LATFLLGAAACYWLLSGHGVAPFLEGTQTWKLSQ
jgi:hypothetical protein